MLYIYKVNILPSSVEVKYYQFDQGKFGNQNKQRPSAALTSGRISTKAGYFLLILWKERLNCFYLD